jgi:antirestriction protein ArdC
LLEVLREDNRAIVRAASRASKAADYLLGFLLGESNAAGRSEQEAA